MQSRRSAESVGSGLYTEGGEPGKRLLLIGHTDGGRPLTLVIARTADPTTWLIVTGWGSTQAERKILDTRQ